MFSQRECLDVLREMGVDFKEIISTGGGSRNPLLHQMMADIFDCPVLTTAAEGPALGAAILAGVGAGLYPDIRTACSSVINKNVPLLPNKERGAAYEPYYRLYKEVYAQLAGQFKTLSRL